MSEIVLEDLLLLQRFPLVELLRLLVIMTDHGSRWSGYTVGDDASSLSVSSFEAATDGDDTIQTRLLFHQHR